ncbi:NUDIX domain-containing protein [Polymorphospora sp. NPDC050346]|uniref:NUDIX domain-containing protein n=1 Tax=Polymorphospora sp. NPDC050346 TaxID=3155780 RepID=UPI0033EFD8D3
MDRRRRIAAYGVCVAADGRLLLVRASAATGRPGVWQVPGGGIEHGEHPADAVVREFAEETGLAVGVRGLRAVVADVQAGPDGAVHTDRVIYDVTPLGAPLRAEPTGRTLRAEPTGRTLRAEPTGRTLRAEPTGTSDRAEWVEPGRLAALPLMPFTAELLGRPVEPVPADRAVPSADVAPAAAGTGHGQVTPAGDELPARGQRFAAYGLVTDPAGRVLLTLIAPGYPGAGSWHLPGGGTDHGEQPVAALLRELAEEADQVGRITALLDVSHRRNPAAVGPEGYPIDWHAVRAIFRVVVDTPTPAQVTEAAGGSTADAAWFPVARAASLPLTDVAAAALPLLVDQSTTERDR